MARFGGERKERVKTLALAVLAAYWLALFVATHISGPPRVLVPLVFADKWMHLIAYALLTILACWNWSLRRAFGWRQWAGVLLLLAVFGVFDEVTQIPFNRSCEFLDWAADVAGILVGVALFVAASAACRWPIGRPGRT